MHIYFKIILIKTFVLFFILSACNENNDGYKLVDKFDPQRDAAADIQKAVKIAQKNDKRILLDVGGEWCIWCHRLDRFIENNREIREYLKKHYIVVKINYSEENKNEALLSEYPEIPGYPHFFVLDKNGDFLHSQGTAELEKEKSYDAGKILAFLKKWSNESLFLKN